MITEVNCGDIGKIKADALITAINPGGLWFGAIDRVIYKLAGQTFHQQVANLDEGATTVAKGSGTTNFKDVVFVIDGLKRPLKDVLTDALTAADAAGCKSVTVPTMRMGTMAGVVESEDEAITAIADAIKEFKPVTLEKVIVVAYNDPALALTIKNRLA